MCINFLGYNLELKNLSFLTSFNTYIAIFIQWLNINATT